MVHIVVQQAFDQLDLMHSPMLRQNHSFSFGLILVSCDGLDRPLFVVGFLFGARHH